MMTISIVTPSLNQGRFIREAIESVRLQNHRHVEHLILDGGSTDNTIALLESSHRGKWGSLRWSSEPDDGQSDALNRGCRLAVGDIIGWLNADDRYRPGCFDHVVRAFEEHPEVDIFYGDYTFMDQDGSIVKVRREIEFSRFVLLYHRVLYIPTVATFFRRRIFEENNWVRQDLQYAMDYEFFLRLTAAGYCTRHIRHLLADFRLHPDSKSCRMRREQSAEKQKIMQEYSPTMLRCSSAPLQKLGFASIQTLAGIMRWSEKMVSGSYFLQHNSVRNK